jgi:HAD superfamily hydrolase (TIGR01459 family)
MSLIPEAPLSALADRYDALVCDVWGVVHNGATAAPAACEALQRFRASGKPVLLLSNAPRPGSNVKPQLDRMSVPQAAYDDILTSGDLVHARLASDAWAWVHRIGPDRDLPTFEGLELTFVPPEEADVAVVTGFLDDETETAENYRPVLEQLFEYEVPLLCANPDIVVERGPRLVPCAGAIAALYEGMGGEVAWLGKPHAVAYEAAFARLAEIAGRPIAKERILAIGDGLRTDILGAKGAGIDALFIAGGIHAADAGKEGALDPAGLAALYREWKVDPRAVAWRLAW